MTYDEMVKHLREKAGAFDYQGWIETAIDYELAADAIEKLIEVIQNHNFLESLIKPNWIPVTERLPKNEKDVLAYYGFKHDGVLSDQRFIGTLCYFKFDPNPHWQHEGQGKLTVTHWMPLPEPPKEE